MIAHNTNRSNQTSNVGDDLRKTRVQLELEKGDNVVSSPMPIMITNSLKKRNASKAATTSKIKSMRTTNDVVSLKQFKQ